MARTKGGSQAPKTKKISGNRRLSGGKNEIKRKIPSEESTRQTSDRKLDQAVKQQTLALNIMKQVGMRSQAEGVYSAVRDRVASVADRAYSSGMTQDDVIRAIAKSDGTMNGVLRSIEDATAARKVQLPDQYQNPKNKTRPSAPSPTKKVADRSAAAKKGWLTRKKGGK